MKIYIAADHGGFELKQHLKIFLGRRGHTVVDVGNSVYDTNDDYPKFIAQAALAVSQHPTRNVAIVIGGSGQGEAIVANRFANVRAALFYGGRKAVHAVDASGRNSADPYELLRLSREHNNANVLSIGARFVTNKEAERAVTVWLATPFPKLERHQRRIRQIERLKS